MLRFYSLTFDNASFVVSFRQHQYLSRAIKKWNSKRIAIEGKRRFLLA
jgi:hypothetical protein